MPVKSISADARPTLTPKAYRGITPRRAMRLVMVELAILQEYVAIDPNTPMRGEVAARLRELADCLDLGPGE